MSVMTGVRVLAWAVVAAMTAAIIFGFVGGSFGDDASALWALPWGKVTLVDLYAGLAIFGGWIALREISRIQVALWWVALVLLGNLAAGAYLIRAVVTSSDRRQLLLGENL